jgi:phosphoadenosine phosphosulfate reductase
MGEVNIEAVRNQLDGRPAEDVVRWAADTFGERVAVASSFGAEDVVLVDMLARVSPSPRVFAIDTGRLHEATYEAMERIRERYRLTIAVYCPNHDAVEALEREQGFYSYRNTLEARHACCNIRKVEPLRRALSGLDAWITGLRREQSVTRAEVALVERDEAHGGILKINPLADWTTEQVWEYIRRHNVPYNRLHDEGYPSIGCEPCTRAVAPGEHPRAGRWWWEAPEHKECGLHTRQREPGLKALMGLLT